jgi:hypothetical protein
MATQFAQLPPSVAVLPFMLARPQGDDLGWHLRSALAAATAAERADDTRRNTRARIAYLLCETAYQLGRRRIDAGQELPLSRIDIAEALGVSLCRVKRTLALLSLSQVLVTNGYRLRVTDWPRLCAVAGYHPSRLELDPEDLEAEYSPAAEEVELRNLVTASGEPACFV